MSQAYGTETVSFSASERSGCVFMAHLTCQHDRSVGREAQPHGLILAKSPIDFAAAIGDRRFDPCVARGVQLIDRQVAEIADFNDFRGETILDTGRWLFAHDAHALRPHCDPDRRARFSLDCRGYPYPPSGVTFDAGAVLAD